MATPRCENCTEEQAVANSQLCDTCEDSFDENARAEGKTRDEYYTELGIIPRFYADADYRRAMKTQWNDGYTACLTNTPGTPGAESRGLRRFDRRTSQRRLIVRQEVPAQQRGPLLITQWI